MSSDIKLRTDKVLEAAAATFRERNAKYGDNYIKVGKVMDVLFPEGVTIQGPEQFIIWHWMDWAIGKLTRFVQTDLTDKDSVHDCAVYLTMIEDFITQQKERDDDAEQRANQQSVHPNDAAAAPQQNVP